MEWFARGLGAFYLIAGLFAVRVARTNDLMDRVLAGIELKPVPAVERVRSAALWSGALLSAASGLSLLLLSRWAAWLFGLTLVMQAAYLAWASVWLKPRDADDRDGRRKTINAAVAWTLATAAVLWWSHTGLLR